MPQFTIKLFGPEAATANSRQISISLSSPNPTVTDLLLAIQSEHANLKIDPTHHRIAVNHEFADPNQPVRPTDEIALIGAVSGG